MTPKERFLCAAHFKKPDMPALQYYYTDVGYAEHGAKLLDLYCRYPGDFSPVPRMAPESLPGPDPADFDADGNYRRIETDAWGVTREYLVYGRIGHVTGFPLDDYGKLDDYAFPPAPTSDPGYLAEFKKQASEDGRAYPVSYGVPGLFQQLIDLRPFEDVLMDIAMDDPMLARLADRLTERFAGEVECALSAGAEVIGMGDDYGTERAMLMSPESWRKFFYPRIKRIFEPAKRAGATCCFHSCGQVWDILPDLKKAGADTIWPQLPLYDYGELAAKLREIGLALCIHVNRGELMQRGTPRDIAAEVEKIYSIFRPDEGGSWFYFEVDQGFPFENVQALAEAIAIYRK